MIRPALADVCIALDAIEHLDVDAITALPIDAALRCVQILQDANRTLAQTRSVLEHEVAERMDTNQIVVEGCAVFERHRKTDRKRWDREALIRDVLDTRLVDDTTGEITDPTPLDKILHVWLLGAPRIKALRERGLDPDEYCATERGGYTIEVLR